MDFKRYLSKNASLLDQEIEQVLAEFLHQAGKINPKLTPFALGLISSCKGGKRIRGTLCKLGFELTQSVIPAKAGIHTNNLWILNPAHSVSEARQSRQVQDDKADREILRIGAALEILHAAILIHDDVIDQSKLRRGKLTLYRVLGGDHYGVSQALAVGDVGLYLPIKLIADANFEPDSKAKAISYLAQTIVKTAWGEVLDVEVPHIGGERLEKDVIAIHTLKTAQYTISGPLILGAILGGGDQGLIGVLGEFGENLGIAFQIQDDILGVFGEEEELGKSVTSDIEEGKNTLLITEALKRASFEQRQILDQYYGKGDPSTEFIPSGIEGLRTSKGLEKVREVFKETGSLDYSKAKAQEYVLKAKQVIPQITDDPNMVKLLQDLAEYLVRRTK